MQKGSIQNELQERINYDNIYNLHISNAKRSMQMFSSKCERNGQNAEKIVYTKKNFTQFRRGNKRNTNWKYMKIWFNHIA